MRGSVFAQPGSGWRQRAFLQGVKKERGEAHMKRLMGDAKAQWATGNRGDKGDWRR